MSEEFFDFIRFVPDREGDAMPTEFFNFTYFIQPESHNVRVIRYSLLAGRMFKVQNYLGEIVYEGILIPRNYDKPIDEPSFWGILSHPQSPIFEKAWHGQDNYSLLVEGKSSSIVSEDSDFISSNVRKNMSRRVGFSSDSFMTADSILITNFGSEDVHKFRKEGGENVETSDSDSF